MNETPLRVHVAIVGFEIDRISKAAIDRRADRIYLISRENTDGKDDGRLFLEKNMKILEDKKIEVFVEEIPDIQNLYDILFKLKEIIRSEKGNLIYINISCGSNLSAIGGTIISMMFDKDYNITPYYVKPEKYVDCDDKERKDFPNLRTIGVKEIIDIVTFPALLPNQKLICVLEEIGSKTDKQISKTDLIEFVERDKKMFPTFPRDVVPQTKEDMLKHKKSESAKTSKKEIDRIKKYAWVNQNIVLKLKDWEMIETLKDGKYSYLKLTKKGEDMLKFLA